MPDEELIPFPDGPVPANHVPPQVAPLEVIPPDAVSHGFTAPELPKPPILPGVAPIWHTVVLVLAIIAYSIFGANEAKSGLNNPLAPVHQSAHDAHTPNSGTTKSPDPEGKDPLRLLHYALSGTLELLVVGWVAFGLRLRKIPFRTLFGAWPKGLNDITREAGIAAAFWLCSMAVLVALALAWNGAQNLIYQHQLKSQPQSQSRDKSPPTNPTQKPALPKSSSETITPEAPQQQQIEMAKKLMELAPANGVEIAAWGLLCLIVGFSEELIFRGYLQLQGIALLHSIPISILLTSVVFGAAHGYQGLRGICLITVYGALFSILTKLRRSLFPGILAHAWHDFITGMALALIREAHLLDKFTDPS